MTEMDEQLSESKTREVSLQNELERYQQKHKMVKAKLKSGNEVMSTWINFKHEEKLNSGVVPEGMCVCVCFKSFIVTLC